LTAGCLRATYPSSEALLGVFWVPFFIFEICLLLPVQLYLLLNSLAKLYSPLRYLILIGIVSGYSVTYPAYKIRLIFCRRYSTLKRCDETRFNHISWWWALEDSECVNSTYCL
jgi:hypothetical protein